jgi:hypothetical protein
MAGQLLRVIFIFHIAAHESLSRKNGLDTGNQIDLRPQLLNETLRARAKSLSYCKVGTLHADEQMFCIRDESANLPRGIYSIQLRQTDIDKNQIGLQFLRLSHGIKAVYGFTDDF